MPLTLMYVTNDPAVARIAERSGVDWIFVDLEIIGKQARQGHLDTVISGHTIEDVRAVRAAVTKSQLLVRTNPIHDGSAAEIDAVIEAGADIVMLPFFTRRQEVAAFVEMVAGRAKVCLLVETPQAAESLDRILCVEGIDYVHIGLNDLHLGYGRQFMFELLADGTVERLCRRLRKAEVTYGFGGIARLGMGELPAEAIVAEHYRLGSTMAILSRSFCNMNTESDLGRVADLFRLEVAKIRDYEASLEHREASFFENNRLRVVRAVWRICEERASYARALDQVMSLDRARRQTELGAVRV